VLDTIAEFRRALAQARDRGARIGLVPTMGALHEGHASLLRRAAAGCDTVAATIFVNPLQFGPREDLAAYPRDLEADLEVAAAAGAAYVFAPTAQEMYPPTGAPEAMRTSVRVAGLGDTLEGASRPGHFDGVATVVAKLFAIAGPCRAYFGEKDYQQLLVVRRMAADLALPVEVVACPTAREPDGLALSSRNARLSPSDRAAAAVLYRALQHGLAALAAGERDPQAVAAAMTTVVAQTGVDLDYAAAVDAADLSVPATLAGEVRLLVAARIGPVRLIDNVGATL